MKRSTVLVLTAALISILVITVHNHTNMTMIGGMRVITFGDRAALLIAPSASASALHCLPPVTEFPIRTE